jgi:CheY-like chemotaxis protein
MVTALPEPPPPVVTDPTRLRQVLLNLLGNAVKFTARGAVELRLRATEDGSAVRFEVADTGPGIPPEQRLHLFQEFARLSTDETRMAEGAGLGLALSARLAALLGGQLGHEDNPGGGSVFWLQLPLRAVAESLAATALPLDILGQAVSVGDGAQRPLKILVADDVAMNRDVAASFLRAAGHDVATVDDGEEAVAAAKAVDFDVILMDVRMPGVDGLEATRRIRALPGRRGRVPVVALTAQVFAEQVERCREAGMDGHLAKPFDPETLFEAVARASRATYLPEDATVSEEAERKKAPHGPGDDLPIFDHTAFRVTASFVSPDVVQVHVQSIGKRCESLLADLGNPAMLVQGNDTLAETVHRLSGSSGLFGFERIAVLGKRCEQALRFGSDDLTAIAAALAEALRATLLAIRQNPLLSPAPDATKPPESPRSRAGAN